MKSLWLRLFPYFIALTMGLALYGVTALYIEDEGLNGLMVNVASGLLSVPIVFIGYELVKSVCDRKLNRDLAEHLYFELNGAVIDIIAALRRLMNADVITDETLETLAKLSKSELRKQIKPDPALTPIFARGRAAIAGVVRGGRNLDVLPNDDLRLAMEIGRQAGIVGVELAHPSADGASGGLLASLETLFDLIDQWADNQGDDFFSHHAFQFVNADEKAAAS